MHASYHDCADGTRGVILTAMCESCECVYEYCSHCKALAESPTPDAHCGDVGCFCHTEPRDSLYEDGGG